MDSVFKKKDFIGLTVCYGIPLGNSVRRYRTYEESIQNSLEDQIKEFNIISVGSKKIKHSGSEWLALDGSTDANHFGYYAFPTKQDALNHLHKFQMISDIKHNSDFSKLSYQEVLDIHKKVFIK